MTTLETQYRNFMEKNPTVEFTFEDWKVWWGAQIAKSFNQLKTKTIREDIVNKLNNKSEFELSKDEIVYIVENWLSIHSQHKMNYVDITFCENAKVSINRDTIFKN